MNDKLQRVRVTILDKEYQVACKADEQLALLAAARELDQRMRKVRNASGVIGADRIAVMVALNLCHELQQAQQGAKSPVSEQALESLSQKLDQALQG